MARVEQEAGKPDNLDIIRLPKRVAIGIAEISEYLKAARYLSAIAIALIPEQTIGATTSDYGLVIEGEGPDRTILQRVVNKYKKRLEKREQEGRNKFQDYVERSKLTAAKYVTRLKRKA